MGRKKKVVQVEEEKFEQPKLKYDPMLLGPNDKITKGMAEYIKNEAPEYMDLLKNYEEEDPFTEAGCEFVGLEETDYMDNEEPIEDLGTDDFFNSEESEWNGGIPELDDFSDSELESMGGLSIDFEENEEDEEWWNDLNNSGLNGIGGLDNFGGRNNLDDWNDWDELEEEWHSNRNELGGSASNLGDSREINREYFESLAYNQVLRSIEGIKEAIYELERSMAELNGGASLGGFDIATHSLNNFKRVYAGWVYEELFSDRIALQSVNSLLEQLKFKFLTMAPHIEAVINDENMVLCHVADSSVVFDCYEDEDYQEVSENMLQLNPRYVPLKWAKENARICPECGLWVDNDCTYCSCGYMFPLTEEQERAQDGDFFDIEMDMEGVTHETVSRTLGGDDFGYCEDFQGEEIHFFGGGMGCTTTVNMPEFPSGLGADDYAFIVLQDNGYRIYHEQIQDALMEINDNNEEVVNETFYRFFKALYKLKGWKYVIQIVEDLMKDDVVYINAALYKTVGWLRENGFVEDYTDEHFNSYIEFRYPLDVEKMDSLFEEEYSIFNEVDDIDTLFDTEPAKSKEFYLAVDPTEIKGIISSTTKKIGQLVETLKDEQGFQVELNLTDADDFRNVVAFRLGELDEDIAIFTDYTIECILGGRQYVLFEYLHHIDGFTSLKANLDAIEDVYALHSDLICWMMLLFYQGLREVKDIDFANELFAHICAKSNSALAAACSRVFDEHNAPIFVELYPTAFSNEEIVSKKMKKNEIYPRVEDGDIELTEDNLLLHLPESMREPCKCFLKLMYAVHNELGEGVIFNIHEGLVLRPAATKEAITKYCQWCGEVFDKNESYLHKHFAEYLRTQIAFGIFSKFTEFMTDEDFVLFENYMKGLAEKGIEDADIVQEYIESVREQMYK